MIYAQFYQKGVVTGETIEACGDRAVIILDGRCSRRSMGDVAEAECKRRGYIAWRIFAGEAFTRSTPVSQLWYVNTSSPVTNPAWLSAHAM
jgi:hypothetical protein